MRAFDRASWPNFLKPSEFPTIRDTGVSVLEHLAADVIEAMIQVRVIANVPIIPSSNWEAHVRFTGSTNSQHYATDRLSTAVDFHCLDNRDAYKIYEAAKQVIDIKGLGIYFDWRMKKVGFHIDTRKASERVQWVCPQGLESREYIYLHHHYPTFYRTIAEEFAKL